MNKCIHCGCSTIGDNLICDNCRNENSDESEFISCSECDGHPACEDFGCAIDNGLEKLVKRDYENL